VILPRVPSILAATPITSKRREIHPGSDRRCPVGRRGKAVLFQPNCAQSFASAWERAATVRGKNPRAVPSPWSRQSHSVWLVRDLRQVRLDGSARKTSEHSVGRLEILYAAERLRVAAAAPALERELVALAGFEGGVPPLKNPRSVVFLIDTYSKTRLRGFLLAQIRPLFKLWR
jgi:hypothetical protein